ncbi:hypothetical protein EXIGLDRAFT_841076 [Exidia glandulosa HHB12029]|uniref:Uncharacterized protein n=1 Tax=Exidia glandulosa HHB12029 TaxID=1314781 RepID=A0A165E3N6_EXIGL|nr:hypothetical protein EXIGLDRAFT_841076 [Exidia glandulosa HHB12029]
MPRAFLDRDVKTSSRESTHTRPACHAQSSAFHDDFSSPTDQVPQACLPFVYYITATSWFDPHASSTCSSQSQLDISKCIMIPTTSPTELVLAAFNGLVQRAQDVTSRATLSPPDSSIVRPGSVTSRPALTDVVSTIHTAGREHDGSEASHDERLFTIRVHTNATALSQTLSNTSRELCSGDDAEIARPAHYIALDTAATEVSAADDIQHEVRVASGSRSRSAGLDREAQVGCASDDR